MAVHLCRGERIEFFVGLKVEKIDNCFIWTKICWPIIINHDLSGQDMLASCILMTGEMVFILDLSKAALLKGCLNTPSIWQGFVSAA